MHDFFMQRLPDSFFKQDVLEVAPQLLGKKLFIRLDNGLYSSYIITETEAYRGEEDKACHACKGRTKRTEILYHSGGYIYVYLIYGMYWMLNFVTGNENVPQAVLIRGVEGVNGPGKVTKLLKIDKTFYGECLLKSERIFISDGAPKAEYYTTPRIGIEYASEYWRNVPWRFVML